MKKNSYQTKYQYLYSHFRPCCFFTAFIIYPLLPEIRISLYEHDGFALKEFVGIENYISIFKDKFFWSSLMNSFKVIGVTLFIGLPTSLMLALILDTINGFFKRFFKIAAFLPAMISVSVIAQVFLALLNPRWGGLISAVSVALGFGKIDLLGNMKLVMPTVAMVFNWQYIGFNMILFYAGIKSIPKYYYEAALLDGAGAVKSAILITIPLLKEIIKFVTVVAIMGGFSFYGHAVVMTDGGPGGVASKTLLYYLNDTAFRYFEFGKGGSAIAIVFVIICVTVTVVINKIISSERIEY